MKQIVVLIVVISSLAVLAAVTAKADEALAQAFEQRMAAQAKIDYDMKQELERVYDGAMILTSSHFASVSLKYGYTFAPGMTKANRGKSIALYGLIVNPESLYFEVNLYDENGSTDVQVQRNEYAGVEEIVDALHELINAQTPALKVGKKVTKR